MGNIYIRIFLFLMLVLSSVLIYEIEGENMLGEQELSLALLLIPIFVVIVVSIVFQSRETKKIDKLEKTVEHGQEKATDKIQENHKEIWDRTLKDNLKEDTIVLRSEASNIKDKVNILLNDLEYKNKISQEQKGNTNRTEDIIGSLYSMNQERHKLENEKKLLEMENQRQKEKIIKLEKEVSKQKEEILNLQPKKEIEMGKERDFEREL